MANVTGSISVEGYQVLVTDVISAQGGGMAITDPPSLPLNPLFGYCFLVLPQSFPQARFAWDVKGVWRDGIIFFPPYPGAVYDVVFIAKPSSIGKTWLVQY